METHLHSFDLPQKYNFCRLKRGKKEFGRSRNRTVAHDFCFIAWRLANWAKPAYINQYLLNVQYMFFFLFIVYLNAFFMSYDVILFTHQEICGMFATTVL